MKLCFPEDVLKQHLVVLGKTGAGKSSALRHIVEHLLRHKKRVCIIDIKGDWWGLKSSADGKSAGFPVIAFGDFREPKAADVPINRHSGQHIAELITSGNRPCIIGFRGWMPADITEFWIGTEHNGWRGFASTLFNKNEGELYVVISECHNFAPKGRVDDPKSGRVLHWTNRLLSEGRGLGMTFLLDSQRPQKVHNDTLTCCETLVAMRVVHKADRDAIEDWIIGCGDSSQGKAVLNSLAGMARGEAWVWSPEIGFGPQRIQFPFFETFDSFAPAQLQKTVSQSGWSAVDLDAVKEKLAAVIEEAKGNDPAALKARIRELEQQPAKQPPVQAVNIDAVIKGMLIRGELYTPGALQLYLEKQRDADNGILRAIVQDDQRLRDIITHVGALLDGAIRQGCPVPVGGLQVLETSAAEVPERYRAFTITGGQPSMPMPDLRPALQRALTESNGNGPGQDLPKAERAILIALAQYPQGRIKRQIATLTGYAGNGGAFRNALGSVRTKGFIQGGNDGLMTITPEGISALGSWEPLPRGQALLQHWYGQLPKAEKAILEIVASAYPRTIAKEDIGTRAGYEALGGAFRNALGRLRTLELVSGKTDIKASEDLFNE